MLLPFGHYLVITKQFVLLFALLAVDLSLGFDGYLHGASKESEETFKQIQLVDYQFFADANILPHDTETTLGASGMKFPFLAHFHSFLSAPSNNLLQLLPTIREPETADIVAVNCDSETRLADELSIVSFPTLILFHTPREFVEYRGPIDMENLKTWFIRSIRNSIPLITSLSEVIQMRQRSSVSFIALTNGSWEQYDELQRAVRILDDGTATKKCNAPQECRFIIDDVAVGHINSTVYTELSDKLLSGFNQELPTAILHRRFETETVQLLSNLFTTQGIVEFITAERFPLVTYLDEETALQVLGGHKPLCLFVARTPVNLLLTADRCVGTNLTAEASAVEAFLEAAKQIGREVTFAMTGTSTSLDRRILFFLGILDRRPDTNHAPDICGAGEVWYFGKFDSVPASRYRMKNFVERGSECVAPTTKSVADFINGCRTNKEDRHVRSEEIPHSQPGPVYKLVGATFFELIPNVLKSFLVIFVAPWCGHSKEALIEFRLAADRAARANLSDVVFSTMDATLNDVPEFVDSYPTIALFPKKDAGDVIIYDGVRTAESLLNFAMLASNH